MSRHLIPTDTAIRAVRPGTTLKRLADGDGLYLQLFVNGGSHGWRFAYSFAARRNILSLGTYPKVGLADARKRADGIRKQLVEGVDPSEKRKDARSTALDQRERARLQVAGLPTPDSFEAVAREWLAKMTPGWACSHGEKVVSRLEGNVFPWMGARPVDAIKPKEILAVLRRVESRGAIETTHRVQQICGQIFRYAVATGRAESDPSRDLRGALTPWKPKHYPTITDPRAVGHLLRDIDAYEGGFVTRCALQLSPLLFVRPGELRRAEWAEIDLRAAEWRIPATKMKGRKMHIVPLAKQAVALFKELEPLTGGAAWVFPGNRSNGEPMSENTVNAALRRLGYDKTVMTAHGFRGMASTILHERGWPSDVVERQLAHSERDEVKAAYNHAEHLPKRRKMMQAWADYLEALRRDAVPGRPPRDGDVPRSHAAPAG